MAGRGLAPKAPTARRNRHAPARGEWRAAALIGWQDGPVPEPPTRLNAAAREAWATWMASWFAAYWTRDDLPGLWIVIRLYSRVASGKAASVERIELRQWMDSYGISKKGQQDRRWVRPTEADGQGEAEPGRSAAAAPYAKLRVVS